MIVAIHQIQFMPGLRFFSKMKDCDLFVFLDDVQYEKREYQNRNKIKTTDGWQYLTLPVLTKGRFEQNINEVLINKDINWRDEHLKKIRLNYARSAFFNEYYPEIEKIYAKDHKRLIDISLDLIYFFRKALSLTTPYKFSSAFDIKTKSTERLIDICKALKADKYLSGFGAKSYLDENKFKENKIEIIWQDFKIKKYNQLYGDFIENMSVLDLIFNEGKNSINYL
jgi:hypothetical protein